MKCRKAVMMNMNMNINVNINVNYVMYIAIDFVAGMKVTCRTQAANTNDGKSK